MTALDRYHSRMRTALAYVEMHLDGELDLESVSAVAAFSKSHFHRQFKAFFGISLHRYVQLARLRRASTRLLDREGGSVTEIALDAGYETSDAFARAFRQRFQQSPSDFRRAPDWEPWLRALRPLDAARSKTMKTTYSAEQVTIRDVAATRVAIVEHRGDPRTIDRTVQRFIRWRKAAGLPPRRHPTFNVWYSERHPVDPADYRMQLCVGVDGDFRLGREDHGVALGEIPAGRCAVLRITADTHDLEPAARYLYGDWLPASGEEMRDFPIYCQRLFLDQPERGLAADLFLPLR